MKIIEKIKEWFLIIEFKFTHKKYMKKVFNVIKNIKPAEGVYLTKIGNYTTSLERLLNNEKTEVYTIEYYSPITGIFIGYLENDEHYRQRVVLAYKESRRNYYNKE